jgi:hypothetical protein
MGNGVCPGGNEIDVHNVIIVARVVRSHSLLQLLPYRSTPQSKLRFHDFGT